MSYRGILATFTNPVDSLWALCLALQQLGVESFHRREALSAHFAGFFMMQNKTKTRRARRQGVPRVLTEPPDNQVCRLRYVQNILLTPSALFPLQANVFRINDLFDPDLTGGGHQSYFRDQMFAIYQYARVLSASIKCTCITDSAQVPLMLVLSPLQNISGTADTVITTAAERKGSKSAYINGQLVKVLSASLSSDKFFGQAPNSTLTDTAYLQAVGSALTGSYSMWFEMLAYGLSASTQNVYVKVEIEQIARFEQPLQQVGS